MKVKKKTEVQITTTKYYPQLLNYKARGTATL